MTPNSRSYLNHFTQPDTIVPNLYNSQDWDRYSYVRNNPLKYTDPSGHKATCDVDENCKQSQRLWRFTGVKFWKALIKDDFGIIMSDEGDKAWDSRNLGLVHWSLQNIDKAIYGKLKSLVGGAKFWLRNQNPADGDYHGVTHLDGSGINFYTIGDDVIRRMNVYHEFGHLLDNTGSMKDGFSGELGSQAYYDDTDTYLFGGSGVGEISYTALDESRVSDPNYGTAAAIQHASTDPAEQWADMFANYVAGNINTADRPGKMMQGMVIVLLFHQGVWP